MNRLNLLGVIISKAIGTVESRLPTNLKSNRLAAVQESLTDQESETGAEWIVNEFGFPVLATDNGQLFPSERIYEFLDN